MNWSDVINTVVIVVMAIAGVHAKDIWLKASTKQRVLQLEKDMEQHRHDVGELNKTLGVTNQSLSALNATVKGLSQWLERVDQRQHESIRK